MKLVYLFLSLFLVVSCGRKSGNTSRIGTNGYNGAGNGSIIAGKVTVYSNECGTNTARVQLGDSSGVQVAEQSVPSGSSFSFSVDPGSYHHLAGVANNCVVSTLNGQPISAGTRDANICLGTTCTYQSSQKNQFHFSKSTNTSMTIPSNMKFCAWNTWGCESGLTKNAESIVESHILLSSKNETSFDLTFEYLGKSNWAYSSPSFEDGSWRIQSLMGSKFKVDDQTYEKLTVISQLEKSNFQFESGFCASSADFSKKLVEYATLQGFSKSSTNSINSRVLDMIPTSSDEFCAYPQEETHLSKGLMTKASKSIQLRRLWFVVVPPSKSSSTKTSKAVVASGISKPKTNALEVAKKDSPNRNVANSSEATVEDLGLGFLVQGK